MVQTTIKCLVLMLAVLTTPVMAGDAFSIKMGVGVSNTENSALYSVGYDDTINNTPFIYKLDFGAWTSSGPGRVSSPYGAFLLGVRAGDFNGLNLQALAGISIVGVTDTLLGSNFQFTEELIVGYKWLGVGYKHVSNAGLKQPNMGRDYVFLNVVLPLTY